VCREPTMCVEGTEPVTPGADQLRPRRSEEGVREQEIRPQAVRGGATERILGCVTGERTGRR
jgi:hypothetical protein